MTFFSSTWPKNIDLWHIRAKSAVVVIKNDGLIHIKTASCFFPFQNWTVTENTELSAGLIKSSQQYHRFRTLHFLLKRITLVTHSRHLDFKTILTSQSRQNLLEPFTNSAIAPASSWRSWINITTPKLELIPKWLVQKAPPRGVVTHLPLPCTPTRLGHER